jgi:hypothetical protein
MYECLRPTLLVGGSPTLTRIFTTLLHYYILSSQVAIAKH